MGTLMYHLAVLDHAEGYNVVSHDGIHYAEVGLLGAIHVRHEIPDFGVQIAGKISLHILGIGIVDSLR